MRTRRVQLQSAWLLHQRPYSDSSRILELLTRDCGRVTLFARGVRGGGDRSGWRAALQPFNRLLVGWSGSGDGGRLTGVELAGAPARLAPQRLLMGFYLNELLLRLLAREDPHVVLFDCYGDALHGLELEAEAEAVLRRFERRLLEELGYGIDFERDAGGAALDPAAYYRFRTGVGFVAARPGAVDGALPGAELLAVAAERYENAGVRSAARRVFRDALAVCLDGRELGSRAVFVDIRHREQGR
ncbi:MAG: DNA repair protein RecO [Gammaproteobacteria bacterium]|nr:DNA repair protein RecO [Gammaproteobacteria bacterium]